MMAPRPEDLPLPKFLSLNRTPPPTPPLEPSSGTVQPSNKHFGLTKEVTMKETSKKDVAAPKKPRSSLTAPFPTEVNRWGDQKVVVLIDADQFPMEAWKEWKEVDSRQEYL